LSPPAHLKIRQPERPRNPAWLKIEMHLSSAERGRQKQALRWTEIWGVEANAPAPHECFIDRYGALHRTR